MRKKDNLEYDEKQSLEFLDKLKKFKDSSKQIKAKAQYTSHKVEWSKTYQSLKKQEYILTKEIEDLTKTIDKKYLSDILDNEILTKDEGNTLVEYVKDLETKSSHFEMNIWYQVKSLKTLVTCFCEMNRTGKEERRPGSQINPKSSIMKKGTAVSRPEPKNVKEKDPEKINAEKENLKEMMIEVRDFLSKMESITTRQELNLKEHLRSQRGDKEGENEDQVRMANSQDMEEQSSFLLTELKLNDLVKGFDQEDLSLDINLFNIGNNFLLEHEEEQQLINEFYKALSFLDERYNLELKLLKKEYEIEEPILFIQNSDVKQRFTHIYNTYLKRGKDRDFYTDRLIIEFPKIPKTMLEEFDNYVNGKEYEKKKRKAILRDWNREKIQLKEKAEEQIFNQIKLRIDVVARERAKMETNQEMIRIKQELEVRRKEFEMKRDKKELEEKRLSELKEKEKAQKEKIWQKHTQDAREKADAFLKQKKEKLDMLKKLEKEKEIELKKEKEREIILNKPKVITRQTREGEKMKEKLLQKEIKEKYLLEEKERIEKTIEAYSIRPKVDRDFNRMIQDTASLQAKKNTEYDKADKVEIFKNPGYTANNLMKDMRYRLNAALFEAGLHQTDYATKVLNSINMPVYKNPLF